MKGLPKMRRVLYIFIACIMMFTLAACGGGSSSEEGSTQQENSQDGAGSAVAEDALVVYFSATGNTESVAEAIAETQGAELYEIVPEDPYTDEDLDYNNSSSRTTAEQNDENARPAISGEIENIDDYDVIYVGFPIWLAYHKLIQCTQLHEWVHFKFTYKIHSFAPAIGRGFFYWQKKSTSFPVWE